MLPEEKATLPEYRPELRFIEPLAHQRIHYTIPVKHSLPKVPNSFQAKTQHRIINKSSNSICIHTNSITAEIGTVSDIKICMKSILEGTRVKVFSCISIVNADVPLPKTIIEENAQNSILSYYNALFENVFTQQTTKEIVFEHIPKLNERWSYFVPKYYRRPRYVIISVFILVLVVNSLVLWNMIGAIRRLQEQIDNLVADSTVMKQ